MRSRLFGLALFLVLPACHVAPPEFPLNEVPVEPLLQKINERRLSFLGMKALARVTIERKGRTRVYESVAVLQQDFRKLKVEAYGPLGESLVALLWDGNDVLVRRSGEPEATRVGRFGLERVLGVSVAPADLCALLSGNVPLASEDHPRAGCDPDGRCILDLLNDAVRWRVHFSPQSGKGGMDLVVVGADLFRGNTLVLRSRFEPQGWSIASQVPQQVILEDPGQKVRFAVDYQETEAGVSVEDGVFTLSPEEDKNK